MESKDVGVGLEQERDAKKVERGLTSVLRIGAIIPLMKSFSL